MDRPAGRHALWRSGDDRVALIDGPAGGCTVLARWGVSAVPAPGSALLLAGGLALLGLRGRRRPR